MPEKILIIDDDVESVEIMKLFLMRQGYQVILAYGGALGLELAHKEKPDLIILDVMMAGMDGFEVARSLRRAPDTGTVPILMITALTKDKYKEKGYESGADIYMTKPIHRMDFQAHIKSLLLQRKAKTMLVRDQGWVAGVIAAKGGLGVSTVALNLGVAYSKKFNKHPIVAELRPGQGVWADEIGISNNQALDKLLGQEPAAINPSMVESLLATTSFGVRLLLASSGPGSGSFDKGQAHFEAVIGALRTLAPLLILDAGTHFNPAFGAVMDQCNEIIVVTEPQPLAVRQTGRLLEALRGHGFGASKLLSLVTVNHTRSDMVMNMSQIEGALSRAVVLGFPPALELSSLALRQNMPMTVAQPESLLAQQFIKLAEQVNTHLEQR